MRGWPKFGTLEKGTVVRLGVFNRGRNWELVGMLQRPGREPVFASHGFYRSKEAAMSVGAQLKEDIEKGIRNPVNLFRNPYFSKYRIQCPLCNVTRLIDKEEDVVNWYYDHMRYEHGQDITVQGAIRAIQQESVGKKIKVYVP